MMKSSMNLLAEASQEKHRSRKVMRIWGLVGLLLILGMVGWSWLEYRTANVLAAERDALERQFTPLKSVKANINRISKTSEQLRTNERFAIELSNSLPTLALVGAIENAAFACQNELFVKELIYQRQTIATQRNNAASPVDRPASLSIRGMAENNLAIAKFAASLRDSRIFSSVALTASESQKVDGKAVQEFELDCTLVTIGVSK